MIYWTIGTDSIAGAQTAGLRLCTTGGGGGGGADHGPLSEVILYRTGRPTAGSTDRSADPRSRAESAAQSPLFALPGPPLPGIFWRSRRILFCDYFRTDADSHRALYIGVRSPDYSVY